MQQDDSPNIDFIASQLRKPEGDFAPVIAGKMDETNQFVFDLTLDAMQISDGENILEIGFGSGKFIHKLFTRADGLHLHGIDYSPDMAKEAAGNNSDAVAEGTLLLQTGSSDAMPYEDGTFDKVYCNMVIFFWDEPDNHLKEVYRVLKPGGRFYSGFRTKKTMLEFPFVKHGFNLYEPGEWRKVLEQNGFTHIETVTASDPVLTDENGKDIRLESVCLVAGKN